MIRHAFPAGQAACRGQSGDGVYVLRDPPPRTSRSSSARSTRKAFPSPRTLRGIALPFILTTSSKLNTIFEVIPPRRADTPAWADKARRAYDLVNGPSGRGVDDLYTPEINSLIKNGGTVNGRGARGLARRLCDGSTNSLPLAKVGRLHDVRAGRDGLRRREGGGPCWLNEIDGRTSDGSKARRACPTILGMNFQEVSAFAEEAPGRRIIRRPRQARPGPLLAGLGPSRHVDASLGRIVAEATGASTSTDLRSSS